MNLFKRKLESQLLEEPLVFAGFVPKTKMIIGLIIYYTIKQKI